MASTTRRVALGAHPARMRRLVAAATAALVATVGLVVAQPTESGAAAAPMQPAATGLPAVAALPTAALPAAAPIDPIEVNVYLVKVNETSGSAAYSYPSTDAELLALVDEGLARYTVETGGAMTFRDAGAPGLSRTFDHDCTTGSAVTRSWAAAGALYPGVDFFGDQHNIMIVIGPNGCGGGVATTSTDRGLENSGRVYIMNDPRRGIASLIHEVGHVFDLQHANDVICTPEGTCNRGNSWYGLMGSTILGRPAWTPAGFDSYERLRLGIAQQCEVPTVALAPGQQTATATYDLHGRGQLDGTRGLQVQGIDGQEYYLDWRNRQGLDANAFYGSANAPIQYLYRNPGVTVARENPEGNATIVETRPKPIPANGWTFAYNAGQTYVHAASGLTVRVDAEQPGADPSATAQVTVTLTDPAAAGTVLPTQQGTAVISGGDRVGDTLTATPTGWTEGGCHRYQWFDDGVPIDGARGPRLTVPAGSDGHRITVAITGQQTAFQPLTATSQPVLIGGQPADTTAPETTITVAPPATGTDTTPTIAFSADEPSTFECSVDGAAFVRCASPSTTPELAVGAHAFAVRAIDAAGNVDATPATAAFAIEAAPPVDTTAPETTITVAPPATGTDTTPAFEFVADEPATFECALDGGAFASCVSPFTSPELAAGSHAFAVRATDTAGNVDATPATAAFAIEAAPPVDTTAPETTITVAPPASSTDATATIAFSADEPATFECALDGGAFAACVSPFTTPALTVGQHTFDVRATDAAGNVDATPAETQFAVAEVPTGDTTAPQTTITVAPPATGSDATPTIDFAADEPATFECSIDGTAFASCTSPYTTPELAEGVHAFEVRAIDAAGNVDATPAVESFTIGAVTEAPAAPRVDRTEGDVVTGSTEPNATIVVTVGDVEVGRGVAADDGAFEVRLSPAQDVGTGLRVTATNASGLTSDPTLITVDEEPIGLQPLAEVGRQTVAAGTQQSVVGTGFAPGESVAATMYSEPFEVSTATADDDGIVRFAWTVPLETDAGEHEIRLVAPSGTGSDTFVVTAAAVVPPIVEPSAPPGAPGPGIPGTPGAPGTPGTPPGGVAGTPPSGSLPQTGAETPHAALALVALLLGAGGLLVRRRRAA